MSKSRVRSVVVPIGNDMYGDTVNSTHYRTISSEDEWLALGDVGHYGFPEFNFPDVGGIFRLLYSRNTWGQTPVADYWRGGINNQHYVGSFIARNQALPRSTTTWNGMGFGATAYSRMKPDKPAMDGMNALYELKDVPAMLKQRFHFNNLKEIGDYHLALQFGWASLLRDTQNLVRSQRTGQEKLKQLLRDNGRPVRRGVTLVDTSTGPTLTSGTAYGAFEPVLVTQYYASQPTYVTSVSGKTKVWANARFRFWLPPGPRDIAWKAQMMRRIYGFRPSPRVVYNAIPWSWLIDYFGNLGDVISNLETDVADRLAADYFYVMASDELTRSSTTKGKFRKRDGTVFSVDATSTSTQGVKTRVKGDPFGLNTSEASLSGMQLGILGALGMSRLK